MAYQLVTCPETAHLEMIEVHRDPLGLLIQACSRFRPPHCVDCARTCAARMDQRDLATDQIRIDDSEVADPTRVGARVAWLVRRRR